MAKKKKVKENCVWFAQNSVSGCRVMTELICSRKDKCSFYETEAQFNRRQREFEAKHQDMGTKKRCIRCREIKDLSEFNLRGSSKDGRESYCRDCRKAMKKRK